MTRWPHTDSTANSTRPPKRGNRALPRWLEPAGDTKPCPVPSPRASRSHRQRTPGPWQEATRAGRGWWAGGEAERRRAEPPLRRSHPRPKGEGAGSPLGEALLRARFPVLREGAGPGLAISLCKSLPLCLRVFLPRYLLMPPTAYLCRPPGRWQGGGGFCRDPAAPTSNRFRQSTPDQGSRIPLRPGRRRRPLQHLPSSLPGSPVGAPGTGWARSYSP